MRRTNPDMLYTDGRDVGSESDEVLEEKHVTHIQTAIRGRDTDPKKLGLADYAIQRDKEGNPVQITCPSKQQVPLYPGRRNRGVMVPLK
jgi:hypothetical protein